MLMQTSLAAVTALAGSLLFAPLMLGPAQAGSAPDLKNAVNALRDSNITLVGHGGGGGHGGGNIGGGLRIQGGGGGGGGGGRSFAYHGGGGGGRAYAYHGGQWNHGNYGRQGRVYAGSPNWHPNGGQWNHGNYGHMNRHYAFNDHDHHGHDNFNHGRHGHFVNGIWVGGWWPGYAGDYYGYNDCEWLRRQAVITGSPYWWSRYNACVGYDYY
jgi:hypothetical protein